MNKKKLTACILAGLISGTALGYSVIVNAEQPAMIGNFAINSSSSGLATNPSSTIDYATYTNLIPTKNDQTEEALAAKAVNFNGYKWHIINVNQDEKTVTLLAADTSFGTSRFSDGENNSYNSSTVKNYLDSIVAGTAGDGKPNFKNVVEAIKTFNLTTNKFDSHEVSETTENAMLYLLSTEEAREVPENVLMMNIDGAMEGSWWLRSPGYSSYEAAFVWGDYGRVDYDGGPVYYSFGVRPALQLNLESVFFESGTKTFLTEEPSQNTEYTITIPSGLDVKNAGWNATDGITAKVAGEGAFNKSKKLTVTAESTNNWALKAEGVDDSIGYNLAASGNDNSVYNAETSAASWEFSAGDLNTKDGETITGKKKTMGIIIEDYSGKKGGNYTDTVTFTAKVENANAT